MFILIIIIIYYLNILPKWLHFSNFWPLLVHSVLLEPGFTGTEFIP